MTLTCKQGVYDIMYPAQGLIVHQCFCDRSLSKIDQEKNSMSSAPGDRTRVVFVHGSGDNATCWQRQVTFLGEERALAVDLPGHGTRTRDSGPPEMSVRDYALDVRQQMQAAGLARPIVAGHSLGGAIALQLALEWGDEMAGLMLIGTGARLRVLPALLEAAQRDQTGALLQVRGLSRQQDDSPGHTSAEASLPPLAEGVFYRDLAACNVFDVMADLERITMPVLVVCGEQDVMTPPKYAGYLRAHLPHATLRLIPESGHDIMRQQPEALNAAISDWLLKLKSESPRRICGE
jgi:pimeloyl-ACP methyl ester carboxylesterase